MNRFLPSKKLLIPLATILVILCCFFLFFKFKNNNKISSLTKNQEETTKVISKEIQQTLKNDTDGDGLKDWEETLWKTDVNNIDTDGDGTDDNSEILMNRNPLIAGPNDFLDNKIAINNSTQEDSGLEEPLTQTDILSRELFAGYVALKQNNQLGTIQEEQFINNLVTKSLSIQTKSTKKYTLGDLNITQNDDQETLQQYVENFKEVSAIGDTLEHDVIIVKRALEKKDPTELEKLEFNAEKYREMQKKLLDMIIPSDISSVHLDIVNVLNDLLNSNYDMSSIFEDPIAGIKGTQSYVDNGFILTNKVKEIIIFCNEKNVKF